MKKDNFMNVDRSSLLCPNWLNSMDHKFGSHRDPLSELGHFSESDRFSESERPQMATTETVFGGRVGLIGSECLRSRI